MLSTIPDSILPRGTREAGAPTILLVEDDATVRDLVASLLRREGYGVLKARHGAEALVFSGEFDGSVDLLLTDLCLAPHFGGRRLAELLRLSRPGIPVLYISGFVEDEGVSTEVQEGRAGFLPKPFSPDALATAVRRAVGRPIPCP